MTAEPTRYARKIRLFDAVMMVMGGIIGAGIFVNPSVVAQRLDSAGLIVGVWVLGGVVALAGAFCFAELGARYPKAGGGYVYLREALHPMVGFLYGWAVLLVIATGAIAAVAVTFARYFIVLTGWDPSTTPAVAVGAIGLLSAINYVGVRPGAITQNLFTVLKLVALAALVVVGLVLTGSPVPAEPVQRDAVPLIAAIGIALVPVMFSYGGWQQTNFIADEIVDPLRTLPKALVFGVLAVALVYGMANLVYVSVLGVDGLAQSTAPAADVMERSVGEAGAVFISAGIAASTFGFLNLVILVSPRVYQAMAADGLFFRRTAQLHPRYRTPTAAIALQAAWATVLTLSGTYGQLLDYVVFADFIFFGLAGISLIIFRRRDPQAAYLSPGYPWVPGIFVVAAFYTVLSSVISNPTNALIGAGILVLGVPVFLLWRRLG